jgi:hypothetical protein
MKKILVTTFILILIISCKINKVSNEEKQIFYKEKGYEFMPDRLKPEILNIRSSIYSIKDIGIDNTIAAFDQEGQFGLIDFDEDLNPEFKPIVEGYPNEFGEFHTDPYSKTMWLIVGRGVDTIDIESKKTGSVVVSNDGNGKIIESFIVDKNNKILLTGDTGGGAKCVTLFDIMNNKKIYSQDAEGYGYEGVLFPYYNNQILCMNYMEKGEKHYLEWNICDIHLKTFKTNKLTEILDKNQIEIEILNAKSYNLNSKIIFGFPYNIYRPKFIIKWDQEFKKVKAEPIILQMPKLEDYLYSASMIVSFDGKWMKTTVKKTIGRHVRCA